MEKQSNTEIVIAERIHCQPWVVVRNCDARYLGGRNKRITSSRPTWDISWDPVSKTKYTHTHNTNQRAGGVAQVEKHKCEALDSIPSSIHTHKHKVLIIIIITSHCPESWREKRKGLYFFQFRSLEDETYKAEIWHWRRSATQLPLVPLRSTSNQMLSLDEVLSLGHKTEQISRRTSLRPFSLHLPSHLALPLPMSRVESQPQHHK
jgi:hypothetical protein